MKLRLAAAFGCALFVCSSLTAQPQKPWTAAELQLALNRLSVVGTALYVAPHPDDENTALMAWLANEKLVRTGYLSLTRGEGGQNLIGSEKGELLGVIRTQELLAARKVDGAEQFFTRAVDFGYSKTPEETLRIWGKESVLADVVWVIRTFRPDVIITRFPATGEGGHGHHTASAILAQEAFQAAGDPTRFTEQLKFVKPWKAKRLLWNSFQRRSSGPPEVPVEGLAVDLGTYNPLLGRSYTEIAADSRSMHKSQGFGSAERRGTILNRLQLIAGEQARADLFDGVDLSWRRFPGGAAVAEALAQARREFDPSKPHAIAPHLVRAYNVMAALPEDALVAAKCRELLGVLRAATGLWIEAIANSGGAPPGTSVRVAATVVNRSPLSISLNSITSPWGDAVMEGPAELKHNEPLTREITARVPADAAVSHPYWLTSSVPQQLVGSPENPSVLPVSFSLTIEGTTLAYTIPTLFRSVDRVKGELYRPFIVAPPLTIEVPEKLHVFTDARPKRVEMSVERSAGAAQVSSGTATLALPPGWAARPTSMPLTLEQPRTQQALAFDVSPPQQESSGNLVPRVNSDAPSDRTRVVIAYDHIPVLTLFPRAEARLVRVDAMRSGTRVGYVTGPGDDVPNALGEIGYEVTLLSDQELERGDLSQFDAIVTGIRAYNTRPVLRESQQRLLDYVQNGGTLVVQYNTTDEALPENLGPYPLKLSRDRVTVEDAPVTLLASDHPLLNRPNKITTKDFNGWVQERGLYFPGEWDPRYEVVIGTADPGESEKRGSILYAKYGKGVYIYTGLAWFRQLPAGVPGAYRLFANLVSARQE